MSATKRGPLIGQGRPAEVFAWEDGRVLKLYREGWPRLEAEQEAHLIRVAYDAGLPVYRVFDVVEVEGRLGIVMERLEGISMEKIIEASPIKAFTLAPLLGELHARVHAVKIAGLPSQRQRLVTGIRAAQVLTDEAKRSALDSLALLPDGDTLCHGDFHPENIVITSKGPVIVDWCTASQGNPLADVANTEVLVQYGVPQGKRLNRFMQWGRTWFRWFYERRYMQSAAHPVRREDIAAWELCALAAQVGNFVPQEHQLWAFPQEQALMLSRINDLLLRRGGESVCHGRERLKQKWTGS